MLEIHQRANGEGAVETSQDLGDKAGWHLLRQHRPVVLLEHFSQVLTELPIRLHPIFTAAYEAATNSCILSFEVDELVELGDAASTDQQNASQYRYKATSPP